MCKSIALCGLYASLAPVGSPRPPQVRGFPRNNDSFPGVPSLIPRNLSIPAEILEDESINCVVELMGGVTDARDVVARALSKGKHVVTANKALLAQFLPEASRVRPRARLSHLIVTPPRVGFHMEIEGSSHESESTTGGSLAAVFVTMHYEPLKTCNAESGFVYCFYRGFPNPVSKGQIPPPGYVDRSQIPKAN